MSDLFGNSDSDNEVDLKTNNDYAKNYNNWRQKEEFNKLKTKYGDELSDTSSTSSEDDDDDGIQLTEEVEKEFFKTLSSLKNKDPRIYDTNVTFFNELPVVVNKKSSQETPIYVKDYERNLILEHGGEISDDEDENKIPRSPTYVEEQNQLKKSFKKALDNIDEDNEEAWGGMFKTRQKTAEEKKQEEEEYKQWLLGQKEDISDKEIASELKPLKDYWTNPQLDENEKFLRDYILNKRFVDRDNEDRIPTYEEIIHDSSDELLEDENEIAKQEEFEYKYNYRFEEPDQEFIKRYPRTMENSLRKQDDRRKLKRAEIKERKQKEKQLKMDEIKQMQALKKTEIEEKILKLKKITGNTDVAFVDQDVDDDFDPEVHDARMKTLFNDEFYGGAEDDQKPEFPDLDEELEIENWDKYDDEKDRDKVNEAPHCEDDEFNMDCDYNPTDIATSRNKKKRRRKSKFAEAIREPKPIFDPNDKTYEQYLDEYYKLDCEDVIGDIPCRFKYRKVTPNSFGLSVEEILVAKDRELNRWCSLKKAIQYRPENVEKYDVLAFDKKGKNDSLKRKLLPSLFSEDVDDKKPAVCSKQGSSSAHHTSIQEEIDMDNKPSVHINNDRNVAATTANIFLDQNKLKKEQKTKNKIVRKRKHDNTDVVDNEHKNRQIKLNTTKKKYKSENLTGISDARLTAYGIKPKKFKNKVKYGSSVKK